MDSIFAEIARVFKISFNHFVVNIQQFSFDNLFLFTAFCLALAFILEAILPRKLDYALMGRKGFWLDAFYVLLYDFIIIFLGIFAVFHLCEQLFFKVIGMLGISKEQILIYNADSLNPVLHFILIFIIIDFMEWLAHYCMHRFDTLWAIHKIHHANEQIGVTSSRRFHLFEYLVFKPFAFIPTIFIGGIPAYFAPTYSFIIIFFAFFTHANAKLPIGYFNYVLNTSNTHIWHHAKNFPNKYGVNFASVLNIWDVIFGLYYLPKNKTPILGVHDVGAVPNTIIGQFLYPFKYWFSNRKISNRYDLFEDHDINKSNKSNKSKKKKK